jgi:hypothetical protein
MLLKWQSLAKLSDSSKVLLVKKSSTLSGGKINWLSLTQALDEHPPLISGKCVYQADSSHSILSDVRHLLSQRVLVFLRLSGFTFPIDL